MGDAEGFVGDGAQVVGGGTLPITKKSPSLEATTAKGTASISAQEQDNDNHDDYWLCLRLPRLPALDTAATATTAPPLTTAEGTASIGAQEHDNDDHDNYWSCLRRPCLPASDTAATAATAQPLSCRSRHATSMPMHMTAAMKT